MNTPSKNWLSKAKWITLGVVLLLVVIVVFQNLGETKVELIFTTVTMPLAALLTVTLVIGFLLGISAGALWKVRHWRSKSRQSKHEVSSGQTTKEVQQS